MVDEMESGLRRSAGLRWRERLIETRWVFFATAFVLFIFVTNSALPLTHAFAGFSAIFATALLFPRKVKRLGPAYDEAGSSRRKRLNSSIRFANVLPDPCFLLDRRSVVTHRNDAAKREFPGTIVGNPIAFSMRNPTLLAAIDRVRTTGVPENVELHQTVPNETWFKVYVAPLGAIGLSSSQTVVTMQNLTEQKRIEAMRGDFVANASHELRTPLTSLVGFIETLQGPAAKDAEARERFLGIMRSQAQRMSNLIDDLLSLSRIELRQHLRPTQSLDLSLLISEVVEGLQVQAREANVEVSVSLPAGGAETRGDREEIYEVFENLIDNAIKYGADGERVEIGLEKTDRAGFVYVANITDHGAGIAEEHVPRLSERFYRVDAESSRKKKGTGLGLAIVKHILNRHGGQMTIKSELGAGTSVEILFAK